MRQRSRLLGGAVIKAVDYREPGVRKSLIYCDPPYKGTTIYNGIEPFDQSDFFDWIRLKQQAGNTLVISEYEMPRHLFAQIAEFPATLFDDVADLVDLGVTHDELERVVAGWRRRGLLYPQIFLRQRHPAMRAFAIVIRRRLFR